MKFGVVIFPGSNCDRDIIYVLETILAVPELSFVTGEHTLIACIESHASFTEIKDLLEDGDINISEAIDYLKAAGYKKSVINKFIRPYKEIGLS